MTLRLLQARFFESNWSSDWWLKDVTAGDTVNPAALKWHRLKHAENTCSLFSPAFSLQHSTMFDTLIRYAGQHLACQLWVLPATIGILLWCHRRTLDFSPFFLCLCSPSKVAQTSTSLCPTSFCFLWHVITTLLANSPLASFFSLGSYLMYQI